MAKGWRLAVVLADQLRSGVISVIKAARYSTLGNSDDRRERRRRLSGFTLLELVVVLFLSASLMAIAYPSYQRHMLKTHRLQAAAEVMVVATRLEHYRLQHLRYPASSDSFNRDLERYSVSVQVTDEGRAFDITATPTARAGQDADVCGAITYSHLGLWRSQSSLAIESCL